MATLPPSVSQHIHVCLISGQLIPNLLPLLLEKPDRVVFLVSSEMTAQAERLKKLVQPRGIKVTMQEIVAYDFDAVVEICEQLLAGHSEAQLTLNVTGGTKIAALAAFQIFFFANQRIIYCDTEHKRLLTLAPESGEIPMLANVITVRDYLTCYGVPRVAGGDPPVGFADRGQYLSSLATLLVEDKSLLGNLNSAMERQARRPFVNLPLNELGKQGESLARIFADCGVAASTGANNLNIPSEEKMFFCKGGWLEEYVYQTVRSLDIRGLDLAINVKVQWDGKGRQLTENEFDVLFTHANRLHLISCKAANPERETETGTKATEALNELDALKDRAGGLFGRPMLVSARRLREVDRERAQKMGIELVDGRDVLCLKERLCTWLDNR